MRNYTNSSVTNLDWHQQRNYKHISLITEFNLVTLAKNGQLHRMKYKQNLISKFQLYKLSLKYRENLIMTSGI